MKKIFMVMFSVIMLITISSTSAFGANRETGKTNPLDTGKEILYYLYWTSDEKLESDLQNLQKELELSDEQMSALKELGLTEYQNNTELASTYSSNARSSIQAFNTTIESRTIERNETIESILDDNYADFRNWIASWWENEREYRMNTIKPMADDNSIQVWATQYVPTTSGAAEVALPDKYLKFANLGWDDTYPNPDYLVDVRSISHSSNLAGIRVDEVGPWNENDNYWDNDRRIFTDLDLGVPEAMVAYYNDYNNGKDEFGRTVLNPAGIDLSTKAAKDLGFSSYESGWVVVNYTDLP